MLYFAMAKLREGTELGWSRLSGFQYDVEGATREMHIMTHAEHLLPTNLRHQFDVDTELLRQKYFREDLEVNGLQVSNSPGSHSHSFLSTALSSCTHLIT